MVNIDVGSHHVPHILNEQGQPLGVKYQSVTRFIDVLEYKGNLAERDAEYTLRGIGTDPDYYLSEIRANLDEDDPDQRRALKRLAKSAARDAGVWNAADAGSFVHRMTEMLDGGEATMDELCAAAPDYAQDLKAYARATAHLRHEAIEQRVILDELRVTGTADRFVTQRGGGRWTVTDLKTGKSMRYGHLKHSMQFALYAMSKGYDEHTGRRWDTDADQDWAIVIHLPVGKGTCDVYAVDLSLGKEYVRVAQRVHDARAVRTNQVLTPLAAVTWTAEDVSERIRASYDLDNLTAVWKEASTRGEWLDAHTAQAANKKREFND